MIEGKNARRIKELAGRKIDELIMLKIILDLYERMLYGDWKWKVW